MNVNFCLIRFYLRGWGLSGVGRQLDSLGKGVVVVLFIFFLPFVFCFFCFPCPFNEFFFYKKKKIVQVDWLYIRRWNVFIYRKERWGCNVDEQVSFLNSADVFFPSVFLLLCFQPVVRSSLSLSCFAFAFVFVFYLYF